MKNMKQNICIKPYNYKQQYQLMIPYTSKHNYIISYKRPVHKYNYSIIPTPLTQLTPPIHATPIHATPIHTKPIPSPNIPTQPNYKQIFNLISTYKHTKVIICTTISSYIIYRALYYYVIYFHINTLFSL